MVGSQIPRIAIVASQYNAQYVQPLAEAATREIYAVQPSAGVDLHQVPGAFEIPLAARLVARQGRHEAIIALGVVIRGETAHADLISRTLTDSLQRISLEFEVPVIHEVLLVDSEEQAAARCIGEEKNRGVEAARAAIEMARLVTQLRSAR